MGNRVESRYGAAGEGSEVLQLKANAGPGKRSRSDRTYGNLQRKATGGNDGESASMQETAARGMSGGGGALPHGDVIQRAFGAHDVSGVSAHVGGQAADACGELNAQAYAFGGGVAFAQSPDLHTAAHEAAHVVQQRAGVQLKGGIGQEGDVYERHADAVADAVVRGESAEGLLSTMTGGPASASTGQGKDVQRKILQPLPLQLKASGGGGAGGSPSVEGGGGSEGASGASPAPVETDPKKAKVARLYMLVDIDVKELGIKELKNGSVGHTWISLEYMDPRAVPDTVHASHKALLASGGRYSDPMGFWPDTQNGVYYSTNLFKSYVQGWMRHPDRAHEGMEKAVQVWELTQDEVDAVIAYAESKRGAKYSVYFFNCTTFAKEAVQAAGKSAPSSSTGGICFPNAAYDGIKKRQEKGEGHTMVTDLDTNNTTEVAGADAKKGG